MVAGRGRAGCTNDAAATVDDAEDLQARLEGKREEALALQEQILKAQAEAQHLQSQLRRRGLTSASLVPSQIRSGSNASRPQHTELQSLLQWLVGAVDLRHQAVFECSDGENTIIVNDRRLMLQRMATWPLSSGCGAGLKLSVPLDLRDMVVNLLSAARRSGHVDETDVRRFADSWDMVNAEIVSSGLGGQQPATFLVHRVTSQAIIVAPWPAAALHAASTSNSGGGSSGAAPSFSPAQHFGRLADAPLPARPHVCMGDRVEVEYNGQWFSGVLHNVEGNTANIKCDVDSPGIITVAPLTNVRPARAAPEDAPSKPSRRMRARSVG